MNKNLYEVIIVDNNSTDSTRKIAQSFSRRNNEFRVVLEANQGLSNARNRGWQEAASDWVAYIDDDAKATADYVERMLHIIENYSFDCFGGVYLPWYKYGKPRWFKDRYAVATNSYVQDTTGPISKGRYAFGGNMVFRRSVLCKFGGFSPEYGMKGAVQAYGEEIHLQKRIEGEGLLIGFDPGLCVYHLVSSYKFNLIWLLKFQFRTNLCYVFVNTPSVSWNSLINILRNAFSHIIISPFRFALNLRYSDYYIKNWIVDVFQPLAGHLGLFVGTLRKLLLNKKIFSQ